MTSTATPGASPNSATTPASPALLAHADHDLQRIRLQLPSLLPELHARLCAAEPHDADGPLLFYHQRHKVLRLCTEQAGPMDRWFFIGDIHGDFYALHTLLRHAEQLRPDCRVVFLGDLVDRGDRPVECLLLLLEWGLRRPGRLAWIAGNHDVAFRANAAGSFESQVSPAELLAELNRPDLFAGVRRSIGTLFVTVAQRLPRAVLFPDGLLATHGGFALADRHAAGAAITDEAAYLDWLSSDDCLHDFTWTRIHRAPKKVPDRYSSGAQYGFRDFEAFCALQPQWFGVQRLVTGHEHPRDGYLVHSSYVLRPALTLIGFGFDDQRPLPDALHHYTDTLHLGQGVADALPQVLPVPVQRGELAMLYPDLPDLVPGAAASAPQPEPNP